MPVDRAKHILLPFSYIYIYIYVQQWGRVTSSRNINYDPSPIDLLQKCSMAKQNYLQNIDYH